jgi:GTPase SAR1 family protein
LAAREALRLEEAEGPASPLGLRITILVVGLAGAGKTQLIASLLGGPLAGELS